MDRTVIKQFFFCVLKPNSKGGNTIKPFLNKLPIIETETLSSYLFRLFERNHQDTPYAITNKTFTKRDLNNNQIKDDICKELHVLTGEEALYNHSYRSLDIDSDKENLLFLKTWTKCCSICMEEQIHQGFTWGFHIVNVCIPHSVYLFIK